MSGVRDPAGVDRPVERVTADLCDAQVWPALLQGVHSVVHLAGNPSPHRLRQLHPRHGLVRCSLTAQLSCGAYFGMANGSRGFWQLPPTTADLGSTARQPPPAWTERQPEQAGRCLMPT